MMGAETTGAGAFVFVAGTLVWITGGGVGGFVWLAGTVNAGRVA
jgi:hypothetical protein